MISKEESMLQQEDINNHQEIESGNSSAKMYPVNITARKFFCTPLMKAAKNDNPY